MADMPIVRGHNTPGALRMQRQDLHRSLIDDEYANSRWENINIRFTSC